AAGGAAGGCATRDFLRVVFNLWRTGAPAAPREHDPKSPQPIRAAKVDRRTVYSALSYALRDRDFDAAVFQRIRPPDVYRWSLLNCDRSVPERPPRRSAADDLWRRRADARLYPCAGRGECQSSCDGLGNRRRPRTQYWPRRMRKRELDCRANGRTGNKFVGATGRTAAHLG